MNDLTSKQAVIATITKYCTKYDLRELLADIEGLPTTKLIRCKDCKHVGTDATCCLVCNREGMGLKPHHVYHDDFCSYAERRTDE